MDNRPIGIFDSGVGGLTVVKAVMERLKHESIVYFGDTARVPYGSKSKETVTKFSAQIIRFLETHDVKAIVIACNTVNANCIEELRAMFPHLPIEGVVEPGVRMALKETRNNRIGIIGTEATIASGKYPYLLKQQNPNLEVFGKACPLFVPLVEEGWANHSITKEVVQEYLLPLAEKDIDTLILGCTHYPMLTQTIGEVLGDGITLINPATEAAFSLKRLLKSRDMQTEHTEATYKFYVSDHTCRMQKMAQVFLDYPVEYVEKVDIEAY
ncbi:glutamate racemase [Niameybacter massiliensis]|uniref:glutamate racemase n=1 Tax=Niameybacter massiliensis TaxID=1658108 RepID=UPI0006B67AF5|nr:glutamate racemase [Niameybacter massiliensis]